MKHKSNNIKNIILGICAVAIAIVLVSSFFITVDFSANENDLQLYRLSGVLLLATFEIGVLLEMDLFGLRKKIPLIGSKSIIKHMLFWFIIVFIGCILFSIPYSMTSADFRKQLNKNENVIVSDQTMGNKETIATPDTTEASYGNEEANTTETTVDVTEKEALSWEYLSEEPDRYKLVLTLLGEHFYKKIYVDSDFSELSIEEKDLVADLFDYANKNDALPTDFTETFTAFCVGDEFEDMFLEAYDNPFYKALSNSFVISWKSDDTYYIRIKEIPSEEEATSGSTEQTEADSAERFIGTAGCEFAMNDSFALDGVTYTIHRLKICAENDNEAPAYNYYKIFYEYTIENNRNDTIQWDMAYNGNLYGLLCHKEAERKLGGNYIIKDEGFNDLNYAPEGVLAAGEATCGYNSVICMPDPLNYPAETWPLYTNEPFSLNLHLLINKKDYSFTISFNQNLE